MSPEDQPSRRDRFIVTSTSRNSATVSPIVLRQTDTVRLIFKPVLVNNTNSPEAAVDGVFCYQRKRQSEPWEDVEAIPLSRLRAGEGVKLPLKSSEMLKLYRQLRTLYETVERDGIPTGTQVYFRANEGTVLSDVASLLRDGQIRGLLETFVNWARQTDGAALANVLGDRGSSALIDFDAAIGVARLTKFIADARANLSNDHESYWQNLLKEQPWVVSQIYASPVVIVDEQAYVGGKSITNQGGSVVDYLYANSLSENSLLVEIKTPTAPLLTTSVYRNGIYGPSRELGGATQQVLHARQTLQENYLALTQGTAEPGFNIFGTKALLVIGTMPQESERVRSFEIFRNAQRGIEIVTFDELLAKGELLLRALSA